MKKILFFIYFLSIVSVYGQTPLRPVPSSSQMVWHEMKYYLFMHFGPNTFTGQEWGHGNENEELFNPTSLDCRQWCRIAKAAGAEGIIITAKHHDGFCLWPSQFSRHTVRESLWKEGKGDVLKELSTACKEFGLKFGVYISPWDRNHPDYGTDKYNDVFVNMMTEIFTNYGPIWELWWDGANGEGPNGKKQVYDWFRFQQTVKKISPQTVIFSDVGPHIRWVGNENGIAGETNWNMIDTAGFTPGLGAPSSQLLTTGNPKGNVWIPAECDVSIRPGWFYHQEENDKVKSPEVLFDLYLKSVGRGANLLLNVPPDGRGLIHENDSAALLDFQRIRQTAFSNNKARLAKGFFIPQKREKMVRLLNDGNSQTGETITHFQVQAIGLIFLHTISANCIVIKENISKGQFCSDFSIQLRNEKNQLVREIKATTIGARRIITFPTTLFSKLTLVVHAGEAPVQISEIEVYEINESLLK